jgi:calcium/proton exchanger cax
MESISVGVAIILLIVYIMYLALHVFHIRAVRRNPKQCVAGKQLSRPLIHAEENEDEDEGARTVPSEVSERRVDTRKSRSVWFPIAMLCVATIGTAVNSELLVGTIEPVAKQLGWSTVFIGLVIVPIVGNAAEHSSALLVAYRDRIDVSMAIAAGSSIQVATFVAPLLVLISLFDVKPLDLVFQPLELIVLGLATLLFTVVSLDGESSWLAGMQLLAVYVMACIVFFLLPG